MGGVPYRGVPPDGPPPSRDQGPREKKLKSRRIDCHGHREFLSQARISRKARQPSAVKPRYKKCAALKAAEQ